MAAVAVKAFSLTADDGVTLEAERSAALGASRATAVLCHPHPLHGGTMRSIVISALFEALPAAGVTCLRFNFRGVEGSEGEHDHGDAEAFDVLAALDACEMTRAPTEPLLLAGWSFGADMTLSTDDPRLAGWLAIAPALRSRERFHAVAHDPRPKLLVLGQHDEFREPASVLAATEAWTDTEVVVVPGASHFFVGRTDQVVAAALGFVDRLSAPW
jgi:alpha/beta superfamily hydrolase